ncbi:MAG: MogA/MoaB family molybdenum cofactor biosynthesis protein [Desulfuromonadales bacterium]|nr:MogA/MoaB family molybdenum cofactor biosynthesis protein [Desulfuromonadales bacterium]
MAFGNSNGVFRVAVLTLSDKGSIGERVDTSGPQICRLVSAIGTVTQTALLPDDRPRIEALLRQWSEQGIDLILTTGGTGLTPRDVTPEATLNVVDRLVPGMAEAMRLVGMQQTPHAMLSRGVVGICKQTLIVNLPGSKKASRENLEAILPALPHALATLQGSTGDCGR